MPRAFTRSIYLYSVGLISPARTLRRALPGQPAVVEDTAAGSRRPPPLFLLSSFSAPSRSQSENVAGIKPP